MRTVTLSDGREFKCERDPAGLWSISPGKGGPLPAFLSGQYTDFETAEKAIKTYAQIKKAKVDKVDVKETASIFV